MATTMTRTEPTMAAGRGPDDAAATAPSDVNGHGGPVGGGGLLRPFHPQSSGSRPAALESAVDAYATRVLRTKSPPESCVDESIGPYVTSIIRCSLGEAASSSSGSIGGGGSDAADAYDMSVEDMIDDFESLVELLEGHCGMSPEVAKNALHCIAISVKTGVVDAFDDDDGVDDSQHHHHHSVGSFRSVGGIMGASFSGVTSYDGGRRGAACSGRGFRSKSVGAVNDHEGMDAIRMLGDMLRDADIGGQHRGFGSWIGGGGDSSPLSGGAHDEFAEQPSFVMDEDLAVHADDPSGGHFYAHAGPCLSALSSPHLSSGSNSPNQAVNYKSTGVIGDMSALTPMKLDRLIPEDLLGVLDNPATPAPPLAQQEESNQIAGAADSGVSLDAPSEKYPKRGKGKKKPKADAQDLAAALFRPSRARSKSVTQEKSPMLKPLSAPVPAMLISIPGACSDLFQQQLSSATQILLSMNGSLGEEAATEAALVSNNDVNVAQYVIDGAMAAPPVCRHMLNDGCYRSDCHFSHDVEGHTCLFWLRGRCGKGESCRFMHGFSEKLLDGIKKDFLPDRHRTEGARIQTTNLVQHNRNVSSSLPKQTGRFISFATAPYPNGDVHSMSSSLPKQFHSLHAPAASPASTAMHPVMMHPSVNMPPQGDEGVNANVGVDVQKHARSGASNAASAWSRIAQQGYSQTSFSLNEDSEVAEALPVKGRNKLRSVKIPQNLWNPSERRSSTAFHIADPLQRYAEVSATHPRKDVIDLHFQSTKTFSLVLTQVLSGKLRQHREVWVLTGTGHHVARNSHQKVGGVLEGAVMSWLDERGYEYARGKDRNGFCGAILVCQR